MLSNVLHIFLKVNLLKWYVTLFHTHNCIFNCTSINKKTQWNRKWYFEENCHRHYTITISLHLYTFEFQINKILYSCTLKIMFHGSKVIICHFCISFATFAIREYLLEPYQMGGHSKYSLYFLWCSSILTN